MAKPRKSPRRPPAPFKYPRKPFSLEASEDLANVRGHRGQRGQAGGDEDVLKEESKLSASKSTLASLGLRETPKNKRFVEALHRVEAEMEATSPPPLRCIVIHYRAEDPLYPSDEVVLHVSAHRTLLEFLVLCARQWRLRPEHPEYPPGPDAFTRRIKRDPLAKP